MAKRVEYLLQNPKTKGTVRCVKAGVKPWAAKGFTKILDEDTVGEGAEPAQSEAPDPVDTDTATDADTAPAPKPKRAPAKKKAAKKKGKK
jgi:hypothetical protein